MAKRTQAPSMDELVDYFLEYYDIPRRSDIVTLTDHLMRLENLLEDILSGGKESKPAQAGTPVVKRARKKKKAVSATTSVLKVLEKKGDSVTFKEILEKTGFDDKKVRNIVFRLNKLGRIVREDRGTYRMPQEAELEPVG